MPKKPGTNPKGEFEFFDVVYEDGSQKSNRRVPSELLGGLEGDEPARGYIIEQDREIAEKSPHAIRAAKKLLDASDNVGVEAGLALEEALQRSLIGQPNQVEAVRSNLEKRAPRFTDPID